MLVILINISLSVRAEILDVSSNYQQPIGKSLYVMQEKHAALNIHTVLDDFNNKGFSDSAQKVISLGLGANPVWLAFHVKNSEENPVLRRIQIDCSWIDKIDVYFVHNDKLVNKYQTGDSLPFSERAIDYRFFDFDHFFKAGETTVFIRAESIDPMVLPIYLMDSDNAQNQQELENYGYGFLYGIIFALLAYNLILFLALKNTAYLLYSTYLVSFLLLNISYTGHGFRWFWPEYIHWQQLSNPLLMIVCLVSGIAFACKFLAVKTTFPAIYRSTVYLCCFVVVFGFFAALFNQQLLLLQLAFVFSVVFSFMMAILGGLSVRIGNQSAKFFLLAAISAILGAISTSFAVSGVIPFNALSFHAFEIGMVLDAILLAFALAKKIQLNDLEKYHAIKMASTDSLTALNNRRAFYDLIEPVWTMGSRHNREVALIMLDIDNFKLLNDNYGHGHGDEALVLLAEVLKKEARASDIVARWGGEEFIVFLPETNLVNAINIAERIRQRIASIVMTANAVETPFTVSIGVAHSSDINDVALDELISIADNRLYSAKEQGRNRVCSHA